jgi:hypothetical protein
MAEWRYTILTRNGGSTNVMVCTVHVESGFLGKKMIRTPSQK